MEEAGSRFPELLAEAIAEPVSITRDDHTVAFLITPERLETLLETREILANPAAMEAIEEAREGRGKFHSLEDFERLLGE